VDVEAVAKRFFQQAVSTFPHVRIELKLGGHKRFMRTEKGQDQSSNRFLKKLVLIYLLLHRSEEIQSYARPMLKHLPEEAGLDPCFHRSKEIPLHRTMIDDFFARIVLA